MQIHLKTKQFSYSQIVKGLYISVCVCVCVCVCVYVYARQAKEVESGKNEMHEAMVNSKINKDR